MVCSHENLSAVRFGNISCSQENLSAVRFGNISCSRLNLLAVPLDVLDIQGTICQLFALEILAVRD